MIFSSFVCRVEYLVPCTSSFRMVFFFPVATGWILYIGLCENSINEAIKVQIDEEGDSVLSLIFIAICVFFLATFNSILYSVTVFVMTVTGLTEMSERN